MERKSNYADRTSYQKNGGKSHLIIRSGEEPELPYQINMIKYNKITGLLPVQFFIEDGEYRYFYDISCKESLAERMRHKKYSIKEIRTVMSDLHRCVQQLEEYLLDVDCLILEPEYMFSENGVLDIQLCFYQDKKETFEESLEGLFEYFMNRLDYQDEKTVLLVYGLYQRSREEHMPLSELMKQFCDIPGTDMEQGMGKSLSSNERFNRAEEAYCERKSEKEPEPSGEGDFCKRTAINKKAIILRWAPYILDVIGGYGIARILWYVGNNYTYLTGRMIMFWMFAAAGIMAACGFVSTYLSHYIEKRLGGLEEKLIGEKDVEVGTHEEKEIRQYEDEATTNHKDVNTDKREENRFDEFFFQEEEGLERDVSLEDQKPYEQILPEKSSYGKCMSSIPATVVMHQPELFRAVNPVLVSKDKEKFQDILLKERTMVIGKLRGIADVCLEGRSISRVHARIYQDQRGCSIMDLGSTNGTFINGIRLKERQRQYLEKGDEIRFAEAVYEFLPAETENVRSHQIADVI